MSQTILIVDDSLTHRSLIKVFLSGHDFEFVEAGNGIAALEILGQRKVDLAIVDLHMPELDGVGLLRRLRTSPREELRSLKVILLTADKELSHHADASRAGADELLRKPVSSAGALEVVLRLLAADRDR